MSQDSTESHPTPRKRAVFLDRDGTIIEDKDYLSQIKDMILYPGATQALRRLMDAGFLLFLVTNQSGIGRGYFTIADVERIHEHLAAELARAGVHFQKIYIAPEHPDHPSPGRKPSPQFLFEARDDFGVDLSQSYMIGDKLIDLECGWNAGVKKSILVRTGYGAELARTQREKLAEALIVDDLPGAAEHLLALEECRISDAERGMLFRALESNGWRWEEHFLYSPNKTMHLLRECPWQGDLLDFYGQMMNRLTKLTTSAKEFSDHEQHRRVISDAQGLVAILTVLLETKK